MACILSYIKWKITTATSQYYIKSQVKVCACVACVLVISIYVYKEIYKKQHTANIVIEREQKATVHFTFMLCKWFECFNHDENGRKFIRIEIKQLSTKFSIHFDKW